MDYKKWFRNCIIALAAVLLLLFVAVLVVDPFFHYHKPIVKYRLTDDLRYQNDGISRNFDFDGVIIGTSMVQNFKCSRFDELFGVKSVKMPYTGAGYEELGESLGRTLKRNPDVKAVLWAVDYNGLLRRDDWTQYSDFPTYLYDENPLNDAPYVFNKDMLYHAFLSDIVMTLKNEDSTSMDDYAWKEGECGAAVVYQGRHDLPEIDNPEFTAEDEKQVRDSINNNLISVIQAHPNTTFYLFFTPYSICNWEGMNAENSINKYISAQESATKLLLECPNVRLYTFFEHTEIICDLNNYRDEGHYSDAINAQLLEWMAEGEGLVTEDNYKERIEWEREFYTGFDYDNYFAIIEQDLEE